MHLLYIYIVFIQFILMAKKDAFKGLEMGKKKADSARLSAMFLTIDAIIVIISSPKTNNPNQFQSKNRFGYNHFGSPGRTRTYNPSVNSRMLCH